MVTINHKLETGDSIFDKTKTLFFLAYVGAFLILLVPTFSSAATITAAQGKDHVGEVQTVCGQVASTHYAASSRGPANVSQY